MKKNYLFVLFIVISTLMNANAQSNGNGIVFGKLSDAITGEMIDFAGVSLLPQGSDIILKSGSSTNGGVFKFTNLPYGKYVVRVSYMGYDKQSVDDIDLSADHPDVNLGTLKLKKASGSLNEVTIVEKKPAVEFGADQITYNVSQSLQAEGSTATDILKNVPMVNVDIDGNITMAGKRNTRIFIDGKPSDYMTSNIADLLNVMPSDAIEKIEVMTNPPAKYSADGEGIINIVLKKGFKVGLNGTLSLNGGTRGNYNANAYVAYRTKGLSITSSYAYGESKNGSDNSTLNQNFLPDTNYHNQYANRGGINHGQNIRESVNWDIDSTQNLRFNTNFNFNHADGSSLIQDYYLSEQLRQNKLNRQSNSNENNSQNFVVDANYTLKMKTAGQIDASLTYSRNSSGADRFLERNYLDSVGLPIIGKTPLNQTYDVEAANHGFEFKVDYDKPLGKSKSSLDLGVAVNGLGNDNNQDVENYNFTNNAYQTNTNLSNRFIFNQKIYSAYSSLSIRTQNKWSFRLGARSELTDVNFDLSSIAQRFHAKPYINVFPNVSVSRLFKNYTIGLSYNGRIGRPGENALNPQVTTSDSVNFSFGNPNLTPAFTQQLDLSFSLFGKNWAFYPRLGYSNTNQIIERITTHSLTNNTYQSTYDNLGASQYYTVNLYGNYRIGKKFNINGGTTVGRMVYQSVANSKLNRNGVSFQSKMGIQIDLPQKIAFESNFNYYTNTSAQGRNSGSLTSSFAVRKVLYKNKLRLRLMAVNPLVQTSYTTYTIGDGFNRQSYSTVSSRNFMATISYNFTKVGRNTVNKQKKDAPHQDVVM